MCTYRALLIEPPQKQSNNKNKIIKTQKQIGYNFDKVQI